MHTIQPMNKEQYKEFIEGNVERYSDDVMITLRLTKESAKLYAINQLQSMLEQGIETPNNYFYAIMNESQNIQIGCLCLLVRERNEENPFLLQKFL